MKKHWRGALPLFAILSLLALPATADIPTIKKPMLLRIPDLTPTIKCPGTAVAGQELGKSIAVWVENKGNMAAGQFALDLVLSSDAAVPVDYALYSSAYQEDVLLQGGREFISSLNAGAKAAVTLNGNNRIPEDTPAGDYYLAAVVDPGQAVRESNERNNVALCRIRINRPAVPDLQVVGFAHTGSPAGAPPECRLLVTVVNRGPAAIPRGSGARVDVLVNGTRVESVDLDSTQVEQTEFHDVHFAYDPANPDRSRSVVGTHYIFPPSATSVTYRCTGVVDPTNVIAELNETNNSFTRSEVIPAH